MAAELELAIAGATFHFELFREIAPRTVDAVVEQLPLEATAYHGVTTGMAVTIPLTSTLDHAENSHVFGAPAGSLLYFPNLNGRTIAGELDPNELVVTYGVTRFFDWTGWQPCSLIGRTIGADLHQLLEVASSVRARGGTPVALSAVQP
jgi:hypothetical protein